MRLSYAGSGIETGEYMAASMSGYQHSISGKFIGREYMLDFSKTKDFPPGVYAVSVARTKILPLRNVDGSAGGEIEVRITDKKNVVVK